MGAVIEKLLTTQDTAERRDPSRFAFGMTRPRC
jgi:hypothetical protein